MTPEDTSKIIAVLTDIRDWARGIFLILCFLTMVVISIAKASPITHTPSTEQPMQYWHTQWVPGDGGVYPQEVYAPALPQVEPELYMLVDIGDPPRLETPEPRTGILVACVVFLLIAGSYTARLLDRAENRELNLKLALIDIKHSNDIERSREIACKALEEKS